MCYCSVHKDNDAQMTDDRVVSVSFGYGRFSFGINKNAVETTKLESLSVFAMTRNL